MSIPKIIHYCWLSNDSLPSLAIDCIATWKSVLSDYEFILWDLRKFDINSTVWTKEAFQYKKYAFAADYIRCYALYNYGGIYLDTDVEVKRTFNPFLVNDYMLGRENPALIEAAVIGAKPKSDLFKKMLKFYECRHFDLGKGKFDMTPLPLIMEKVIKENYNIKIISDISNYSENPNTISIFEDDFFSPKSCQDGKIYETKNTISIHHYNQSWQSPWRKYGRKIVLVLGGVAMKNKLKKLIFR